MTPWRLALSTWPVGLALSVGMAAGYMLDILNQPLWALGLWFFCGAVSGAVGGYFTARLIVGDKQ